MLDFVLVLTAVAGFYLFSLRLLCAGIPAADQSGKNPGYFFILLAFMAWAMSSGLCSLVPVWGYFTDMPVSSVRFFNGGIGAALVFLGWPALGEHRRAAGLFAGVKLDVKEKIVLGFMGFLLLLYVYRVLLPWSDHDEVALYGYWSKLVGSGRTFSDMLREDGPAGFTRSYLAQSWDAQWYALVHDTFLIRFNRLVNLVFCGAGLFSFLRLVRVGRLWSMIGVAAFWATPELSYLALSLKADAVVMMFELAALLAVIMGWILCGRDADRAETARTAFYFSAAALCLAAFAFGNRFSGIIPMLLAAGSALFFLFRYTRNFLVSAVCVLTGFAVCTLMTNPGWWVNILFFNNPVFPTQGFWPFQNGAYVYAADFYKSNWNIIGLPFGVLQVYLLFALGTGLELIAKVMPILNHLPMAAAKTESMGWPYPLLLCVCVVPFFMRSHRALNIVVAVFLFQFICWTLGLHYSRIFIASAALMTAACVMMADQRVEPEDIIKMRVQAVLKAWVVLTLVISLMLQLWWFGKRCFGPLLVGDVRRHQAEVRFLQTKEYAEKNVLTLAEVRMLNKFFVRAEKKPVVYIMTRSRQVAQILFDGRIFIRDFDLKDPWHAGGDYLLVNPVYAQALSEGTMKTVRKFFPQHVMTTPQTGWDVYEKARLP